jgi:ABC-type glycerol-3-phosphate transport system permease component
LACAVYTPFFMSIPREMDEAAMIDGASPFRTLVSVK